MFRDRHSNSRLFFMMNRVWLVAVTATALTLSYVQVSRAQSVAYDFTVDVMSGPLTGERYMGAVDLPNLLETRYEAVEPISIKFDFGDIEFTDADDVRDIDANSPRANFQDGNFMGSTYIVSRFGDRPTEIPLISGVAVDGFAIDNSEFGYIVGENLYQGMVSYAALSNDSSDAQSVPEPNVWLGLGIMVGWLMRRGAAGTSNSRRHHRTR